jgi:hypothetical protein
VTPSEVRDIIEREIAGDRSRRNAHGCTFDRCLVEPHLIEYPNSGYPGVTGTATLWVVLEEDPQTLDGYKIVFDEATGKFGLALPGYYMGPYGSFLKAFDSM